MATERRRANVKPRRDEWFKFRQPAIAAQPERVIFLDETAVKTNLTRLRGWAPRGQRLTMEALFGGWKTQTLIAGLCHDALIAPWVISGAMDGAAFATYISKVLVPEIEPRTAVVVANLAAHGCWFLYLPQYSPDMNPIEMAFAKLKAHLRRIGARTFTDVFHAIGEICEMFDPDECWNYFKAAGYVSGLT